MAKIRELTQEEAERLRQQVRLRFLCNHSNRNGVRPTSFKGAYEDLRLDIIGNVPEAASAVSLTRLRKLFYYTDPAACPTEQLEKPSFGRDFIEALKQYVQQNELPIRGPRRERRISNRAIGLLLIIFLFAGGIISRLFRSDSLESWREDFDDTDVQNLQEHGFGWCDFDTATWSKQIRDGYLTLYTMPGDYWVKPHEQKIITNLMYKKVQGDCFTVFVKVDDFDPQHNCQQLTLFLFDERLSRETHLRAGIGYWTPSKDNPGVQHSTTEYQESGQVTQQGYYHFRNPANEGAPVKTFWLKILYKDNKVTVLQKINQEWNIWAICAQPFDLRFKPAYLGIAAFQGWTENDGTPRDAAPVPVFIDYLQVESCD
jgi:hypothetical protein